MSNKIHKEKHENKLAKPKLRRRTKIQLQKCSGWMRQREKVRRPVAHSQRNPHQRDGDNADQDRAPDAPYHQDRDQHHAERRKNHLRIGSFPECHKRGRVRHDDVRVAESHERDEKADASSRAVFQAIGNAVDDLLANIRKRQDQEQHARKKNDSQRRLPRHTAPNHDRIREVRVQRHAGRERNRVIRPDSHHQRRERRRSARGEKHALDRHARLGQNPRIHHDHVRHGHERRQPGEQFGANRRLVFPEMKDALEQPRISRAKSEQL